MKKKSLLLVISLIFINSVLGQQSEIDYELETQAIGTTNDIVPFWFRSNQFGSIPSEGLSSSFIGRVKKNYSSSKDEKLDWGFGFEGRGNIGSSSKFILIEGYAKVKKGVFELKGGRSRQYTGLIGDQNLSMGSFSMSGNSLGIPQVQISIPEFYTLPIFGNLFSFKGSLSHGWLGQVNVADTIGGNVQNNLYIRSKVDKVKTYFHQKSLYARIGKENWKMKLYGGFNHQVFWGNEKEIYGDDLFKMDNPKTLLYVITGKTYGGNDLNIPSSKIGNQLGSIDMGLEYNFENHRVSVYRQNFYEVGALFRLANLRDGLNGILIENRNWAKSTHGLKWRKIQAELFYSKNQAGEKWSKATKSGDEDYYNNYFYSDGWTYKGLGLGNPFITSRQDARTNLKSVPKDYYINNRVIALNLGIESDIRKWTYILKLSYSKNYGTYGTSSVGRSTGSTWFPPIGDPFEPVSQFSSYLEGNRMLSNDMNIGYALAYDYGDLLYNTLGLRVRLSKKF